MKWLTKTSDGTATRDEIRTPVSVGKILSIIPILLLLVIQNAEGQITQYANFILQENGEMIWQQVYERPGSSFDSLKKVIYSNVTLSSTMRIIEENDTDLVIAMNEMIFEKNGDLFNGRLIFEVKEGKYRVTISGVRRFFGVKTKTLASVVGVSNEINDQNVGIRLEDSNLSKDGKKLKGLQGLDLLNGFFTKKFDYKTILNSKKTDW